jgi:hypothetical protein
VSLMQPLAGSNYSDNCALTGIWALAYMDSV